MPSTLIFSQVPVSLADRQEQRGVDQARSYIFPGRLPNSNITTNLIINITSLTKPYRLLTSDG